MKNPIHLLPLLVLVGALTTQTVGKRAVHSRVARSGLVGLGVLAVLLAVRPDDFPEWTFEGVEGSVLEALELAKLRGVDPDALGALGHYLPALYFAYNAGGSQNDAVSVNFNNSLRSAQLGPN